MKKFLFNKKNLKIFLIFLLNLLFSFLFWWSLKSSFGLIFLTGQEISLIAGKILLNLFLFACFFGFYALSVYLIEDLKIQLIFSSTVNFPYLLFFNFSYFALSGFIFLVPLFIFWGLMIDRVAQNLVHPRFFRFSMPGLAPMITIFLLIVAFSFYLKIIDYEKSSNFLPRLESLEINLIHSGLRTFFTKDYQKDISLDAFIFLLARHRLWQKFVGENLSAEEKSGLRQSIAQKLGTELIGEESMDFVVKRFVNTHLTLYQKKYEKIFPGAAALVLFLFLKLFSFLYHFLIRLFAWGFLEIFLALKFIKKRKEMVEAVRVGL